MNNFKLSLLLVAAFMTLSKCHFPPPSDPPLTTSVESLNNELPATAVSFNFNGNGKGKNDKPLNNVYTEASLENFKFPEINREIANGLRKQLKVLKYQKKKGLPSFNNVDINNAKLEKTIRELLSQEGKKIPQVDKSLSAYQIKGEDGKGNVFFTGYFTPVLQVSKTPTERFKYPLFAKPKSNSGRYPTRAQIDGEKVLKGKGLELAYAESLVDIYFMQVQGSGIVQYQDGSRELFAYAGSNRHSYRSIGKYMIRKGYTTPEKVSLTWIKRYLHKHPELIEEVLFVNSSYIFFERAKYQKTPKGAGLVSLTTDYSIAVDPNYIPLGSCLLAKVPIIKNNRVIRHEYRVLIAQDKGGAIKGPGHIDLYSGVGTEGRKKASALHHYGKLWLLLPKDAKQSEIKEGIASL